MFPREQDREVYFGPSRLTELCCWQASCDLPNSLHGTKLLKDNLWYLTLASKMTIELRTTLNPTLVEQLHALYQDEWWTEGRTLPDVEKMLRHSDLLFAYVDADGTLAGFARVLTDHVFKAFVFDVIVHPRYRGTGLGARIMRDVTTHPVLSQVSGIELYCRPELNDFYRSFGFVPASGEINLMRRARNP